MAKNKEELAQLKAQRDELASQLKELTEDELKYVAGGDVQPANVVGCIRKAEDHNIMLSDN